MINRLEVYKYDNVRDISPLMLDEHDRLKILPAGAWHLTTRAERAVFGHRHAIYSFPTVELVEHLRDIIGDRTAIEIGAGHGVLAEALGIPATDSRQQEKSPYREIYAATGQPPVRYGPNIIEMDAGTAVRHFRPDVVIGCWVTHRFDKNRPWAEGNAVGIDELDVIDHCRTYVFIGNEQTHRRSRVWSANPRVEYPSWLYSRASNGYRDVIAVVDHA